MAAFVLAVTADGHRRGQEACIEVGLINVCLKHLQGSTYNDVQTEPLYLQWLCLCLGKLWEDFTEAQVLGLQADAPAIVAPLLTQSQPEVCLIICQFGVLLVWFSIIVQTSIKRAIYFRCELHLYLH